METNNVAANKRISVVLLISKKEYNKYPDIAIAIGIAYLI